MSDATEKIKGAELQKKLSPAAAQNLTTWLTGSEYTQFQQEITRLINTQDWQKLEDCFFQVVPFGTGGRRGTVGLGPNRINTITIGQSAQGVANYILKNLGSDAQTKGVVVAHDTRITSRQFAELTAAIFSANGFKTYLFDSFRATPELSFAIRHLGCVSGAVISASHNPPADNGFKAYWQDGGQVVPPHDKGILTEVTQNPTIKKEDFATAVKEGRIAIISEEVDKAYHNAIQQESVHPARRAAIVYSPLHGAGSMSVTPVLKKAGFTNLTLVAEQNEPDGNFSQVPNQQPNPEVKSANELTLRYCQQQKADVGLTTDPDADRLGVIAPDNNGAYQLLTGNQIAALLAYYVAKELKGKNELTPRHFIAKTIVTTDVLNAIARDFSIKIYDNLLVGFKYIAELIEKNPQETFLLGGEESYGILKGTYTRDKDAAVAALLMAEYASALKDQGKTLIDALRDLHRRYGVYWENQLSTFYHGAAGFTQMKQIMKKLRSQPPASLGNITIVKITDRLTGRSFNPAQSAQTSPVPGATGDVIVLHLSSDGRDRLTIRPSGTEPKLKIYAQVYEPLSAQATEAELTVATQAAQQKADQLLAAAKEYLAP
jgi:phosphoglucomutase/phosphomannomutase